MSGYLNIFDWLLKKAQTKIYCIKGIIFFPGLSFYVHIESPNPKNPEGPTPQVSNPIN